VDGTTRVQIAAAFYARMTAAHADGRWTMAGAYADALLHWAGQTPFRQRGFFDDHRLGITLEIQREADQHIQETA
jgi:hypothetical protein